ncbi:LPS export ABC transporter permease LptG [Segnochrobactrum spirostomi]|uniref:LPS export ABC transporter permease LptG n=1 Tax=Segnochrobactrum spirostomi TaxID=2608987 RepID=A0A6A7XZJ4_9HYPH|nr:LPS export ABC transporter permease LptG [Segnochrobactrum spirostomi]MQT11718.1 LPS export ABC transporter permease LptG [Segnochrobactrum spirostomi]
MIGRTLAGYLSTRFARWIIGVFLVGAALVFIVDFFELMRRAGDRPDFSIAEAALISLMRTPSLTERVLPFAALFGGMAAFVGLTRRSELVVIRAAGVSIWQFLAPAVLVTAFIGLFAALAYNPAAAWLKEKSDVLSLDLLGREQLVMLQTTQEVWLRQRGDGEDSVLHADQVTAGGTQLTGVTIFVFDEAGNFLKRIEADHAVYERDHWRLTKAIVYTPDAAPHPMATTEIATEIRPTEILEQIAQPDAVSFWQLPGLIDRAERAGLAVYPYRLQFQSLLSLPVLLSSMIVIAATVSLRVSRFGGTGRLVASGVAAGFVLYVATEIARDFGSVGIISPTISAWSPGIVAALLGSTILLNVEDG